MHIAPFAPPPAPRGRPQRFAPAVIDAIAAEVLTHTLDTVCSRHGLNRKQLGKLLRRIGLPTRSLPEARAASQRGGRAGGKSRESINAGVPGHHRPFVGHGLAAIEAKPDDGCSWPSDNLYPDQAGFSFCGKARAEGKSYCAHHQAVAYPPMVWFPTD